MLTFVNMSMDFMLTIVYNKNIRKEVNGIDLKEWVDAFFKAWTCTVATIALIHTVRKERPPRKAPGKGKPKRKR